MLQAIHASAQVEKESPDAHLLTGNFSWKTAGPIVHPKTLEGEDWIAVKDPSVVQIENRWHLFCTVRGTTRSQAIFSRIPAGRWGEPDDFQGPVVFLASKASDYMSGQIMLVDGGWMGR
jgi:NAD(P)-dependent dehydrogenase (short-subunit alcohol dehydrogenase family)